MEAVMSFVSGEVVGEARWQACCRQRHREVNTPVVNYCRFMQLDINHLLRGRWWPLVFEVWPGHCSGWHLSPFMNLLRQQSAYWAVKNRSQKF